MKSQMKRAKSKILLTLVVESVIAKRKALAQAKTEVSKDLEISGNSTATNNKILETLFGILLFETIDSCRVIVCIFSVDLSG
ncbi:MAG: hypothetical protein ABI045_06270 [Flavobacteriales bacterium]